MKLLENISRIKSMMLLKEEDESFQELFDNFISNLYPSLDKPQITKHKLDIWIDDENGDLMFTYFPLNNEPGKFAITHVDDDLKNSLEGMFGEHVDELLKNWFKNKFNLHVDYILE
jgi:hypothetical protein